MELVSTLRAVEKRLEKVKAQAAAETGLNTLESLRAALTEQAGEITFVKGPGHRKSEAQRRWERLSELERRWTSYERDLEVMGADRNSYSKTDPDAAFMRLKVDHMRNGQLKPAYNVQLAVNSEYITGIEVFSDRSDVRTLQPFLRRLEQFHQTRYEEVPADAGYESLDNYLYLESTGQTCFIIKREHGRLKTRCSEKMIA